MGSGKTILEIWGIPRVGMRTKTVGQNAREELNNLEQHTNRESQKILDYQVTIREIKSVI